MSIIRKPKSPSTAATSSDPSTPKMNYHVFLSFRGEDTRKNFTDHLYDGLNRKGIKTFRDEEEIRRGEAISEELKRAIEESLFAIVVFSRNYASSSWCLDELQKIVESRKDTRQSVFPVFYDVDPSDLRHQTGNIGAAFEKHEERFSENIEKVEKWRKVLAQVAGLSGWDIRNKHEAPIIEEITAKVFTELWIKLPPDFENLVGIQSKVNEMISLLKVGLDDKFFIGIWGMGGIGKTTLARVVYAAIRRNFQFSCFLANVRENSETSGLVPLQKKLLSCLLLAKNIEIDDSYEGVKAMGHFLRNKKVLLVLDDVSHRSQLENLAGNEDWFGVGSRIIVTTRDIRLLTEYEQFETYKVEMLHRHESLKLLCRKAFKKDAPEKGFLELSEKVVEYSGGLPLALEVLGSFLHKRSQDEWSNMLDKLEQKKQNLPQDIFNTLRISYDGLEDEDCKSIFLDIACFSNWREKVEVRRLLENCGYHSKYGINILVEKSLLSSSSQSAKGFTYMHDLLQDMGRKIVLQESPDASSRSRLWSKEEIDLLLKGNKGTEKVQCIVLDIEQSHKATWHPDCLSNMHKLRLLDLSNVCLSSSLNYLPSALKVLIWDSYALEALPCIDQLFQLGGLQLCNSKIRKLWNGAPSLRELKVINVSDSKDLTETPDFTGTPKLERMLLDGCVSLVKVHESLGQLKNLVNLSLKGCKNLVTLPRKLETTNLKTFMLSGCSKLKKLPEFGESMESLSIIDATETSIRVVPWSIIHLTNLQYFDLDGCCRLCSTIPRLPENLFTFADRCLCLEPSLVLHHLFASLFYQRPDFLEHPTHLLYKDFFSYFQGNLFPTWFSYFQGNLIPTWFEQREYKRDVCNHPLFSKKKIHSGSISITADIPHGVVDYKREWLGIAVCLVLEKKFDPATWRGFYINWRFKDCCHPIRSKREIVIKRYFVPLYLGFFPFDKKCCPMHPTGVGCQVGLTIYFTNMVRGERISLDRKFPLYRKLRVMECGWRLIRRNNLDA